MHAQSYLTRDWPPSQDVITSAPEALGIGKDDEDGKDAAIDQHVSSMELGDSVGRDVEKREMDTAMHAIEKV